jgi:hypothetical protein
MNPILSQLNPVHTFTFIQCIFNEIRVIFYNSKVAGSIPDEVNFKIYLILPAALGPGVYSAFNRNEYQKH